MAGIQKEKNGEGKVDIYKFIFENSSEGIVGIDSSGKILMFSRGAQNILGYDESEVIGKEANMFIPPGLEIEFENILWDIRKKGKISNYEAKRIRKDGKLIDVDINYIYLEDYGIISIFRDFSHWKAVERKIKDSRDAFLNMIKDLDDANRELQRAYDELKKVDTLKDNIIANVSHEIKTPITIARGALELGLEENDMEEIKKLLEMARAALDKQDNIVSDLVKISQIEKMGLDLNVEDMDLKKLLGECIDAKSNMAKSMDIIIQKRFSNDVPEIKGDYTQLKHAFIDIIDNAIKFNKQGGKVIIEIQKKSNIFVEVVVMDTGIGISQEELKRIFDPLYQADASASRKFSGTGMGLTLANEIVNMHKGFITVQSEIDKGSQLRISLPISW